MEIEFRSLKSKAVERCVSPPADRDQVRGQPEAVTSPQAGGGAGRVWACACRKRMKTRSKLKIGPGHSSITTQDFHPAQELGKSQDADH